jgi:hypothetical protein
MDETSCRDFFGSDYWERHAIQWCASGALAGSAAGHQVIWFYRAPWTQDASGAATPGAQQALAHWLEQNRCILNMRRQLGSNLLLINAARVAPATLRARLDQVEPPDTGTTIGTNAETAHARLLGQLFERSAPQYWDVLEALEAASWLPSGDPMFRGAVVASEEQLFSLLDALGDHPRLGEEIAQLRGIVDGQVPSIRNSDQEAQELRQEGELLLLQLHQVQEELEQYYLKNIDLEKAAAADKKAAAEVQKALAASQQNAKALQVQLRQMQDELKRQQVLSAPPTRASIHRSPDPKPRRGSMRWFRGLARKVLGQSEDKKVLLGQLDAIRNSEWFDPQWYLDQYPDVRAAGIDPIEHYFNNGWKENRNPGAGFDTAYYLSSNPDVAQSNFNPLWHFIEFGRKERRLPRKP